MSEEQIKQKAEEYAKRNEQALVNKDSDGYLMTDYPALVECYIAGAHSRDEEIAELEQQHEDDQLWLEEASNVIKFWKAFFDYLSYEAIGDKSRIIETVANNDYNWFEGYVNVTKSVNDSQEIIIEFENNGNKYKATWQPSDNYACFETSGMFGDDYSGYLLFPTYTDNKYFCLYYKC